MYKTLMYQNFLNLFETQWIGWFKKMIKDTIFNEWQMFWKYLFILNLMAASSSQLEGPGKLCKHLLGHFINNKII